MLAGTSPGDCCQLWRNDALFQGTHTAQIAINDFGDGQPMSLDLGFDEFNILFR